MFIQFYFKQKSVNTRNSVQESKMKTRAMAKGTDRKISLVEAKRNSRQRMVKAPADNVVKDIYGNVRKQFCDKFNASFHFNLDFRHLVQ